MEIRRRTFSLMAKCEETARAVVPEDCVHISVIVNVSIVRGISSQSAAKYNGEEM